MGGSKPRAVNRPSDRSGASHLGDPAPRWRMPFEPTPTQLLRAAEQVCARDQQRPVTMTSKASPKAALANPTSDWVSPATAVAMLKSVPTGHDDFGYALLERTKGTKVNTLATLIKAKLQPSQPTVNDGSSTEWPVTAFDHKLVLARKVPQVSSIMALAKDYDAHIAPPQTLLALLLTMKFGDMERHPHDAMSMVIGYAEMHLAKHGVSSCVVQHSPGAMLSEFCPHVHIIAFAREHTLYGWSARPENMNEQSAGGWLNSWLGFQSHW